MHTVGYSGYSTEVLVDGIFPLLLRFGPRPHLKDHPPFYISSMYQLALLLAKHTMPIAAYRSRYE